MMIGGYPSLRINEGVGLDFYVERFMWRQCGVHMAMTTDWPMGEPPDHVTDSLVEKGLIHQGSLNPTALGMRVFYRESSGL